MDYFTDFVKASVGDFVHMSGCLLTGALDGKVTANHDDSAIVGATITVTDTHGLSYSASTDDSGHYGRPCLPQPTTSPPRPTATCRPPSPERPADRRAA